jgi:hypothetical protein
MHLLSIFPLEISCNPTMGQCSPTFRLCAPLCIILWVYIRALEAHQFHSAAVNIAHGLPQSIFWQPAFERWNNEKKKAAMLTLWIAGTCT